MVMTRRKGGRGVLDLLEVDIVCMFLQLFHKAAVEKLIATVFGGRRIRSNSAQMILALGKQIFLLVRSALLVELDLDELVRTAFEIPVV